jgi:transposase-like protein
MNEPSRVNEQKVARYLDLNAMTPREKKDFTYLIYTPANVLKLKKWICSMSTTPGGVTVAKICNHFNIDSFILRDWCDTDPEFATIIKKVCPKPLKRVFYDEEVHAPKAEKLLAEGYDRNSVVADLDISLTVFYKWIRKYKTFSDACDRGKNKGSKKYAKIGLEALENGEKLDVNLLKHMENVDRRTSVSHNLYNNLR